MPPTPPQAPQHPIALFVALPPVVVPPPHALPDVNIIAAVSTYPHCHVPPVAPVVPQGMVGTRLVTHVIAPPAKAVFVLSIVPPDGHPVTNVVHKAELLCHGTDPMFPASHTTPAIATKLSQVDSIALVDVITVPATHAVEFEPLFPPPPHVGTAAPETSTRFSAVVLPGRSEMYDSSPFPHGLLPPPLAAAPPNPHLPT